MVRHLLQRRLWNNGSVLSWISPAALAVWSCLLHLIATAGVFAGSRGGVAGSPPGPLPSTLEDFFQRGSQPEADPEIFAPILSALSCSFCHGNYAPEVEPYEPWQASMLGQSARDPLFFAGLTIANQDVEFGGQLCIRCHVPGAFLSGRSLPTDGSAFEFTDFEGVSCNFCHRAVNPQYMPEVSPIEDLSILSVLESANLVPIQGANAQYVIDPMDSRRGPFGDEPFNPHFGAEILVSPFHQTSEFCWTCHDVSNPLVSVHPTEGYLLNELGESHPSADQHEMFPLHRTYSEWKNSYYFTAGGIQHFGRFGGNHPTGVMHTCQDCHMPDQKGYGCSLGEPFFERPNVPQHSFAGSNTWVLDAVRSLYPDSETGLSEKSVADAKSRTIEMLANASDMFLTQSGTNLRVRIVNMTGHKLPTGFPDGRRMWINVKFFNIKDQLIGERGAYDFENAVLTTNNTKVYETELGISEAQAALVNRPAGHTYHFLFANVIQKDNRIPPQGFSNTIALQTQTKPVGATYVDGQHWDDTLFAIPPQTTKAVVTVYYQLTSRPFIEFLRDANTTDNRGQIAYDQWLLHGKSAPVVMDSGELVINLPGLLGDLNGDGFVNAADLGALLGVWGPCPPPCSADFNNDGVVNGADLAVILGAWTG